METITLETNIGARVTRKMHKLFQDKAHQYGDPSDVLRELVSAFIDDRITIVPDPTNIPLHKFFEDHKS